MATPPTAATQQDIQNSEKLLDLSNQLIDSINERKKLLKGINAEERLYLSTQSQQQRLSQDIAANADKYLGYQIKSKDLAKQIKATQDNANKTRLAFSAIEGKITQQYQDAVKANSRLLDTISQEQKHNASISNELDRRVRKYNDLKTKKEQGERVSARELRLAYLSQKSLSEQVRESNKVLNNLEKEQQEQEGIAKTAADIIKNGKEAQKSQQEELDFLKRNLHTRKQIEKSTGLLGAMSKSVSKIPGIGQYLDADEANDEMEKMAAKIEESGGSATSFTNRFKIGLKGVSTLAKGLVENLKSPEAIFAFIIARANQFNKASVDISKNLGYGTDSADRMAQSIASAANYSTNINVTFKNAVEAMGELNAATGGVAEYSADTLETQIMLTKQLGLSGEEAAGIYKFSVLQGKSSSEVNKQMVTAFANTRNMVKGSANFKATMAEVAKVSGQLAANFRNNPAAITAAVVQAQALGTTLEKSKAQGEKLLDFDTSIESELKAELLTGQQMNLERARAAALQGDQVTVMKELANQGMTLEKFQSMNVVAQKSFAEALGLSADELSDQLNKQKIAKEQGKSLAEITAEEALEAEKRQSIQDKFSAAMEKLQDIVGNLVGGPFGLLLDMLSDILKVVGYIVQPLQFMYDLGQKIGSTIGGWLNKLGVVGKILKVIAGIAIVLAAFAAASSVAELPFVGWALAPIVAAGILGLGFGLLNSKPAGDMISPADGKTQVSTKEGGLFELSKNDDLVAGPGLAGKAGGGGGETIAPQIDLTPMISAINEVKAAVDRLYNKESTVNMDGKEVGTTLTQNSYKVA